MDKPYSELKDKYGNPIYFGNLGNGSYLPAFPSVPDFRQHATDIRNLQLNPNDIFIAGFPKTGTHWNFEIISMLLQGRPDYVKDVGQFSFIDLSSTNANQPLPPPDKPRILFSHLRYNQLPKQLVEKKVKVVYLERNPKDTFVSYFNHSKGHKGTTGYDGDWNQFFELVSTFGCWYGDWFDYVLDWESVLESQTAAPILTMTFEKLKADPVVQIQRLDQFLGLNRGRELCEKIADACSFTKLKEAKDKMMPEDVKKRFFKDDAPGFYRKGDVGDWKNWFTVAQDEYFDALYAKRMQGSKLSYIYTL